jgi:hypothetical protein
MVYSFEKQGSVKDRFLFEKQGSAEGKFLFLKNKLILIPFNFPKNWSADYITQTTNLLSKNNKVIAFLWEDALSLKEILFKKINQKSSFSYLQQEGNILYFTPIHFIPFRRFVFITNLNFLINIFIVKQIIKSKKLSHYPKILWLFYPSFWPLIKIFGKNWLSLYDCADFFTSTDKKEKEKIHQDEIKMLEMANKVFTNSYVLYKDKNKYRKEIYLVPQGFSFDNFKSPKKIPKNNSLLKLKKPIIGYIGGINHRIDYPLIKIVVKDNPDLTFLFIGPIQEDFIKDFEKDLNELKTIKNVHFLENQPREILASIINYFDVCLIPYNAKKEFNKLCYPMKIFEYFYIGKPTVSTLIEELKRLQPYVKIAKDAKEFSKEIKNFLKKAWPKTYAQKQKELAIANSWVNKIKKIDQVLYKNNA